MQSSMDSQNTAAAQTVLKMHRALVIGIALYAVVAQVVVLPHARTSGNLWTMVPMLLIVALALCAVPMLLITRVPRRSAGESANEFWLKAVSPALISWMPLEGAALLSVTVYSHTGSMAAIAVAALAVLIMVLLRPGYFEAR